MTNNTQASQQVPVAIVDHCWEMYRTGQISADHTAKEVFAGVLQSFSDWLLAQSPAAATPGQVEGVPYTSVIGDAGEQYLNQFMTRHPLPATFRWHELWEAMQHAALKSASVSEQKGDA